MKTILNFNTGRNLTVNSQLPAVQRSPEGEAMGSVPGWLALLDPAYPSLDGLGLRNRVEPSPAEFTTLSALTAGHYGTFPNGAAALLGDVSTNYRLLSSVSLTPSAFTLFMVMSWVPVASPSTFTRVLRAVTLNGDLAPSMAIRTNNALALFDAAYATNRIEIPNPFGSGEPVLVMFTGSTRDGLRAYKNGALVAQNSTDKAGFNGQYAANQWSAAYSKADAASVLKYGQIGALSVDLGWPEYAPYRAKIVSFMKSKYGIS